MKVHFSNLQKDLPLQKRLIVSIVRSLCSYLSIDCDEIGLYFVTKKKIAALHKQYFDDPTPTDCITFPIDSSYLGEIFVCPAMALSYTESYSRIGVCQGGAQSLSQAKPALKQLNLKSLAMQADLKICGCPTQAEPILESRAVYKNPFQETILYVVHGLLHLIGYDDLAPKKRLAMRKKEKSCMDFLKSQGYF